MVYLFISGTPAHFTSPNKSHMGLEAASSELSSGIQRLQPGNGIGRVACKHSLEK